MQLVLQADWQDAWQLPQPPLAALSFRLALLMVVMCFIWIKPPFLFQRKTLCFIIAYSAGECKGYLACFFQNGVFLRLGNTAQSWWCRCAARFFVRLYRNDAAGLAPSKEFLCKMTEKMQADVPSSRQAGFVRCCLYPPDAAGSAARIV